MKEYVNGKAKLIYSGQGLIWKVFHDKYNDWLAIEVRDGDQQQASFVVLNPADGQVLLMENALPNWWTGIHDFVDGCLFLYEYEDLQYPQSKSLAVFDVKKEKLLWKKDGWHYQKADSYSVTAFQLAAERHYETFEVRTGAVTRPIPEKAPTSPPIRYPDRYTPDNQHYNLLQQFIAAKTQKNTVMPIDYWENESFFAISFVTGKPMHLATYLLVYSLAGEAHLAICLNENDKAPGSDIFFVHHNSLFFIQEKQKFYSLPLD